MIELSENDGDLPLTECVVERVINGLREDVIARRLPAVYVHPELQPAGLLVTGNVRQLGQAAQFFEEYRSPIGKLGLIRILQGVLELCATDAAVNLHVLDRLHEE